MTSFRLLVVAFFIVMVVHKFLTEDAKVSLLLLLISVIVLAQSKWLLTQYMKIEAQFLANLRGHHGEKPSRQKRPMTNRFNKEKNDDKITEFAAVFAADAAGRLS